MFAVVHHTSEPLPTKTLHSSSPSPIDTPINTDRPSQPIDTTTLLTDVFRTASSVPGGAPTQIPFSNSRHFLSLRLDIAFLALQTPAIDPRRAAAVQSASLDVITATGDVIRIGRRRRWSGARRSTAGRGWRTWVPPKTSGMCSLLLLFRCDAISTGPKDVKGFIVTAPVGDLFSLIGRVDLGNRWCTSGFYRNVLSLSTWFAISSNSISHCEPHTISKVY